MKPTKQTVYIPAKEHIVFATEPFKKQEGYFFTPEQLNGYTQDVIKQTLETAAEKAKLKEEGGWNTDGTMWLSNMKLNKKSITSLFVKIFKTFEV